MDEAIGVIELPLFPLNTVLFPGQMLPLHIFEERYRLMIRRCLAEDLPFGVVLIKRGSEVGVEAEPHEVGTIARILKSTHQSDGTIDIVTVGQERFCIDHLIHDQPYLRGEVKTLPMQSSIDSDAVATLADRVRDNVSWYIKLIAEAAGLKIQVDAMPDTPQQLGYLAGVAMQIDNREKQEILASSSLSKVLAREIELLNRENALLRWMIAQRDWPGRAQFGASGTLLPN
jgi:Lon protease-like protein